MHNSLNICNSRKMKKTWKCSVGHDRGTAKDHSLKNI